MEFIADLHLHSHFSRATAKNLTLESLYIWAQKKGVTLVGTGDFTHPEWIQELEEKLEPAAPGLFKLKKEFKAPLDAQIPSHCKNKVRFILQCEISSIYKKADRVRKNHNLIYFPDIEGVKTFNARLDKIGNIASDGRPILGLDAEKLLEIMLDVSDDAFLIPAHIWTPWFSMLGSKSGFNTIEECFGDLSHHIFAVETGLSSDPPMNWRVANLDHVRLVASSDAHSPMYLGRNASMFNTGLSYYHVREALETGDLIKYQGTIDMFPQEGKYHHDGHRKCGISFDPEETLQHNGTCPVCGKPLTLGVLYRVQELASRPYGYAPTNRQGYQSIVPLTDILSEIFNVGPKTKKVNSFYERALKILGPELDILLKRSLTEIDA
ncbi:MAG: endonuclease Q family protein, partial [Desulfobacterium sp.]